MVGIIVVGAADVLQSQEAARSNSTVSPVYLLERPSLLHRDPLTVFPRSDRFAVSAHPEHYAEEGAIIGGVSLGVAAAIIGAILCDDLGGSGCSSAMLGGAVVGGLVGAVVGGLIGATISKDSNEPETES
jgi:hypothetical protein